MGKQSLRDVAKQAWDNAFDNPINFDHKPTADDILEIRLAAVTSAILSHLKEEIDNIQNPYRIPSDKQKAFESARQAILKLLDEGK